MTALFWVLLFGGIALVGALVIGLLLWGLWRKVVALLRELDVLAGQVDELATLAEQIEIPDRMLGPDPYERGFETGSKTGLERDSDLTASPHDPAGRRT